MVLRSPDNCLMISYFVCAFQFLFLWSAILFQWFLIIFRWFCLCDFLWLSMICIDFHWFPLMFQWFFNDFSASFWIKFCGSWHHFGIMFASVWHLCGIMFDHVGSISESFFHHSGMMQIHRSFSESRRFSVFF